MTTLDSSLLKCTMELCVQMYVRSVNSQEKLNTTTQRLGRTKQHYKNYRTLNPTNHSRLKAVSANCAGMMSANTSPLQATFLDGRRR